MYSNNWALLAYFLGFFVLIADVFLIFAYILFRGKRLIYWALILLLFIATLIFPLFFYVSPVSLTEVTGSYFFFALTLYVPNLIAFRLSKSKSDFAAYLFALSILGFIIYVSGGTFSGSSPQ